MSASDSTPSPITMDSQVIRDVDRIIDGLDYCSFELLPGTVNPRPGMRYIADSSPQLVDSEVIEDFRTDDILIEDVRDGSGGSVPYFLPSTPYWQPFLIDLQHGDGRKKKKNKKKRNKNRQRQLPYQFHLQVQVEQEQTQDDVSPDISDGSSTESPTNSPIKMQSSNMESPDKKGKKKRSKQRRRGSGRGRRLFPDDIDFMNIHLNGLHIGSSNGIYGKPDTYSIRSPHGHGPSYGGPGPIYSRGPLWVPHPVIYSQC